MKKGIVIIVVCLLLVVSIWQLSRSRTFQYTGTLIHRVDTDQKKIALTFDDGPVPEKTTAILHLLERLKVPATFFLVGRNIERYPELTRNIVSHGHELGNHSYSHQRMVLVGYDFVQKEIEQTDQLIRQAGFTGEIRFRPPNCLKLVNLPRYLAEHNITSVTWDVEPETYVNGTDSHALVQYTLAHTRPGSIILLHPMYAHSKSVMAALPKIVHSLRQQGYTFVTLSGLLQ